MILKQITLEQRPRERAKEKGIESLSDAELVAILLEKGTKGENVIDLSNRLISTFGLQRLNSLSLQELMKIKGIKLAKASKLLAAFELSRRVKSGRLCGKTIRKPSDVASYYIQRLKDLKREHFIAVFLDSKNKIIKDEIIFIGTLNGSLIHPREVFKEAIRNSANSIILIHNHPSGDVNPSDEDIQVNKVLIGAGDLVGIKVLDHLIIGNKKWKSLID